ncbi:MAG TPA: hypothetical protein VMZ90_01855 [Vicinamibacterales bacterium]|nr:hypothetical protein [Vicinamibacterales bacterium]
MKRIAFAVGPVIIQLGVLLSARTHGAPAKDDALTILRAALGGEVALTAVQTIRARGTIDVEPYDDHFDVALAMPDRFVSILRTFRMNDASWSTGWARVPGNWDPRVEPVLVGGGENSDEQLAGFVGDVPLFGPRAVHVDADISARWLERTRAKMAEFVLPLLGGTPPAYPVVARSEAYAITFSAVGGREWRLEIDPVTHLPARIIWSYRLPPTAPLTAKSSRMQVDFSDFRLVGGLRWPHHLITYRDGKKVEDATVKRYEVNAKLAAKMFRN